MVTAVFVLLACAAFSAGMYLLGLGSTIRHTRMPARRVEDVVLPPLSLLKPIKGVEEEMEANLRSFFEQGYPGELEIVFSSEAAEDPGVAIARRLATEYPHIPTRFVISDLGFGLNPKVANLAGAYKAASHDLVMQSDANVRATPGYLERIVRELLAERAALLSSIVVGVGERTVGAALENLQLTALIGASVCTALHVAGVSCVIGKSMLMRRSDVEALGGLEEVRDILCEDFVLGKRFQASGRKVLLSTSVVQNVNRGTSIEAFLARHSRWLKMRVVIHFGSFVADLFANPIAWSFLAMLVSGFDPAITLLFAVVVGLKMIGDAFLMRRLRGTPMALRYVWLGPLKDLVMFGVWFYSLFSRSVTWRGRKLRFGKESRLRPDDGKLPVRIARRLLG